MSRYRTWPVTQWHRGHFAAAQPDDRMVMFAIHLGPYSQILPGVSICGWAAMLEACSISNFDQRIADLLQRGAILMDRGARLWVVPEFIDTAAPANHNLVKGWRTFFNNELIECLVKQQIDQRIRPALIAHGHAHPVAFKDGRPTDPWAYIKGWDSTFDERPVDVSNTSADVPHTFPRRSLPETETAEAEGPAEDPAPGKGTGFGKGKANRTVDSKPEIKGGGFECICGGVIYKSTDGRKWNDEHGRDEHVICSIRRIEAGGVR